MTRKEKSQASAARRAHYRRAADPNRVTAATLRPSRPRKSRATSLTSTQRDSAGRRSDWSRGATLPYGLSVTTHQVAWDRTVSQ